MQLLTYISMKKLPSFTAMLLAAILFCCCKQDERTATVAIPFEFVKNQLLVKAYIQDEGPYNLLFDTGVTPSVIDIGLAKQLKLPIDTARSGLASGRGNQKVQLFPAQITQLKLGTWYLDSLEAVTLDQVFLGKALGKPLHGILGYSLMKGRIFKIDYQHREIQFFRSREQLDKTLQDQDAMVEKFIFQEGDIIPIVKNVTLNGKPFLASLDTGSSLSVEIFSHHLQKYAISIDSTKSYQITGAQGKDEQFSIIIDELTLAGRSFHDIEGGVGRLKDTLQLRQGNIGNKFLRQFKQVSFDYQHQEVIFE